MKREPAFPMRIVDNFGSHYIKEDGNVSRIS
jgi:hypothetical protein